MPGYNLIEDFINQLNYYFSYFRLFIMQEHQKLLKKSNKSVLNRKARQIVQHMDNMQGLLKIDLLSVAHKKMDVIQLVKKNSRVSTSRKSHKSLAINLKKLENRSQANQKLIASKVSKTETIKANEKQSVKQTDCPTQRQKQSSQNERESFEHDFVEKKMRVGKKFRSNAMKDFILQTLSKGKAEGTCLIIHKGTAQCSYSSINKNKSEAPKNQKEEFPVIQVQDNNKSTSKKRKHNESIFKAHQNKVNRSSSTKTASINLPSANKKWVKMTKEYEIKHPKVQKNQSIIEVIQQKIQIYQEERQVQQEEIHEEIVVSYNESLLTTENKLVA